MTSQLQARPQRTSPAPGLLSAASRPRVVAALTLLLLLLVGTAATLSLRPPSPRPASAPATDFSADRAMARIGQIAAVPHTTGSAASAEVRTYLVNGLRELGLDPQVQSRVAARTLHPGRHTAGSVSNVHARIAGTAPTGRVLLLAHYDSVPTGPGASDDGANVAAILEIVRALRAGPQPRNDIDVLFTDGEEHGLLGAQAFVDSGAAGDPRRVVAVNLEARGVSGRSLMFEMAGTGLVGALRAADPVTTSFAAAVYEFAPNDTDLTALHESGMRGLNFAFTEGTAHYHTPHDDIAHVSDRSVQDAGEMGLTVVRYLAGSDLAADGSDATYFSLFGMVVSYPAWLGLPLAGVLLAGYVALLTVGRRRGLRLRGVGRAAVTFALVMPGAVLIGSGGWWLLTALRPDFLVGFGAIYHPGWYALPEAALLLVALVAWYRWARRKASAEEVAAGVLGWLSLFAVLSAVLLPGAAYLFTWPALAGVAALAAALWWTGPDSPVRILASCAAAVVGMALILPIALLLLPVLGLWLSAAPLLLVALIAATAVYVLEPLPRRRLLSIGMAVVVAAAATTMAIDVAVDRYDADQPRAVSLAYTLEADTGTATWVSVGGPDQPHVGPLLTGEPVELDDRVPPLAGWLLHNGPAQVVAGLATPELETPAAAERDGVRTVDLSLRAPAGAYVLDVFADTTGHEILESTVDGIALPGGHDPNGAGRWRWRLSYAGPPSDGIDVTLRVRGSGPLPVRVVSTTAGLPSGVGAPGLSPEVSWSPWPMVPAQTFVVRTFQV